MKNSKIDQKGNIREVSKISWDNSPPVPERSAFTFYHNLPRTQDRFENAKISEETRHKVQVLKQKYNDIVSQHSSDIGLTHLDVMKIGTDPELPIVASKHTLYLWSTINSKKKKLKIC